MIATKNISTHPREHAGAAFCNSVALVEGCYWVSRGGVVRSDFSATPNLLKARKVDNLLSPISNIRAISHKLYLIWACRSPTIIGLNLARCSVVPAASFNPASVRSHATTERAAGLCPATSQNPQDSQKGGFLIQTPCWGTGASMDDATLFGRHSRTRFGAG
jgi:hypothetical protein